MKDVKTSEFGRQLRYALQPIVDAYCESTGQTPETLSRKLYNQPSFLRNFFRFKRSITVDRLAIMFDEIGERLPKSAKIPYIIPIRLDRLVKRRRRH